MIHIADYITVKNIMSQFEKEPNYPLDMASLIILGISDSDLKNLEDSIGGILFDDEVFK